MSEEKIWIPDLKDWSKVNVEAYKVMFQQAKDRFEAHVNGTNQLLRSYLRNKIMQVMLDEINRFHFT